MAQYTRRSARTSVPSLYQNFQSGGEVPAANPTPVAATPPAQKPPQRVMQPEPMVVTKATGQPQAQTAPEEVEVDVKYKRPKTPKNIKRARRNKLLSRMIQPKPALMLLHELKPGVVFFVKDPHPCAGNIYCADAVHEGKVLGSGTGSSKNGAKHKASEMALKQIVRETMNDPNFLTTLTTPAPATLKKDTEGDVDMEAENGENEIEEVAETPYEKLPWVTLASLALHRMFAEWKEDGVVINPPALKPNIPNGVTTPVVEDVKLPENAALMHPVSLLNQMHPGIRAEELQRTNAPNSSVTIGYRIDGQLYTGTATNAKAARKIAAQHACTSVYAVKFT